MQTILTILLLGTTLMAVKATPLIQIVQAGAQDINVFNSDAIDGGKIPLQIEEETTEVEHFTLGNQVEGALPIYSYTNSISYDAPQDIVEELSYPAAEDVASNNDAILTQIVAHVEGSEGMECQVYVINGGIGDRSVTLQFVAHNTASLRYVVVVYGTKSK